MTKAEFLRNTGGPEGCVGLEMI